MDNKTLLEQVKKDNIKYISLQFTDVTGTVKSVDIPPSLLADALEDGVWFDGSSVEGFARVQESDMRLVLDPGTYSILPWSTSDFKRARIFCDIYRPGGDPFLGDPRGVLKRVLNKKVAMFGSYGWSGGALKHLKKIVEPVKWELVDSFEFIGKPTEEDLKRGDEFGDRFAEVIKNG